MDITKNYTKKIQKNIFWILCSKFKTKIFFLFLSSTLSSFISILLGRILGELWNKGLKNPIDNLLIIKTFLNKLKITKICSYTFALICLLLLLTYFLISDFNHKLSTELEWEGEIYITNQLIEKFRKIPYEERIDQKTNLNNLIQNYLGNLSRLWIHIFDHLWETICNIFFVFFINWENISKINSIQIIFSITWISIVYTLNFFVQKKKIKIYKQSKTISNEEWETIEKEKNNSILIEASGLTHEFRKKQQYISKKVKDFDLDNFFYKKTLPYIFHNYFINITALMLLIILDPENFDVIIMHSLYNLFSDIRIILSSFEEKENLLLAYKQVYNFLNLKEKDDNLKGIILPNNVLINTISFKNVFFKYKKQKKWILENYSNTFSNKHLNYLSGNNGFGKSTIIFLLLGMLKPFEGEIIIELNNGQIYNINEINLDNWRTQHTAFIAHQNLIEKGSTGQRQLANINKTLLKQNAKIWLSDEADNALDKNNKYWFTKQLEQLINEGKIVIYISHKENKQQE